ncbi:MAG: polysaccharide biosynthesis/export family protein [Vicinamibacterales bacterium]
MIRLCGAVLLVLCGAAAAGTGVDAQSREYVIGAGDVLAVTVWNQLDQSGKFTVEPDGTVVLSLLGRVKVEGLTATQLAEHLKVKLSEGFFKNPDVTVAVESFNSRRLFVLGEVRKPGEIPLKGPMTLVEALATAGGTVDVPAEIIVIRRDPTVPITGPNFPGTGEGETVRIDAARLNAGDPKENLELADGDTVFVPRPQTAFVAGQVRTPGAYPIGPSTTVLQLLALAGGVTERGAAGRTKVIRLVDGSRKQSSIKLTDVVRAGDTIVVPERFF